MGFGTSETTETWTRGNALAQWRWWNLYFADLDSLDKRKS